MKYLKGDEYDLVLLTALRRLGISAADARTIIQARFPQCPPTVVVEAAGRGLTIVIDDVLAYIRHKLGDEADTVFALGPPAVEDCFAWCVAEGRAKSNEVGLLVNQHPGMVEEQFVLPARALEN